MRCSPVGRGLSLLLIQMFQTYIDVKPAKFIAPGSALQGTASTLTRTEVRGGGKKPYAQKGTGNARRGSNTSPLFPGGGVSFGPKVRLLLSLSWRSAHVHTTFVVAPAVPGRVTS